VSTPSASQVIETGTPLDAWLKGAPRPGVAAEAAVVRHRLVNLQEVGALLLWSRAEHVPPMTRA